MLKSGINYNPPIHILSILLVLYRQALAFLEPRVALSTLLDLPDPPGRSAGFLPEEHVQLRGVFLDMPHGIEQQLGGGLDAPVIPNSLGLGFVYKTFYFCAALGARLVQVGLQLLPGVCPLR